MIPAPNSYFLAEEAKLVGNQKVLRVQIFPHYLNHGIAAGEGVYTDCFFVPLARIQVSPEVGDASWVSEDLAETDQDYPIPVTISWESDHPGYNEHIYYKTANSQAGLAAASWVEAVNGNNYNFDKWHKLMVAWTLGRSWATDAEEEEPWQAYAVDSVPDDYESYAVDALASGPTYIDRVRLAGEYGLDVKDVLAGGSLSLKNSYRFDELVAADHSLRLYNRDNKFDPDDPNFIFQGSLPWYGKLIRIKFGYARPGWKYMLDLVTLYEGFIEGWGPIREVTTEVTSVEIYSRGIICKLLETAIGQPAADGAPNPVVHGEFLAEARAVGDANPADPYKQAGFEGNNFNELDTVTTDYGGTLTISSASPKSGLYCARSSVAAASSCAFGTLRLAADSQTVMFAAWVKFATLPEMPADKIHRFIGLSNAAEAIVFALYIGADNKVWGWLDGAWKEGDFNLAGYEGIWLRVVIGVKGGASGNLKVWINGDEILNWGVGSFTYNIRSAFVGMRLGPQADTYVLDFDDLALWPSCYMQMFRVSGWPFAAIASVYTDGRLRYPIGEGVRLGYGFQQGLDVYDAYPQWGAVDFPDLAQEVSGTVMIRVKKDDLSHPVDQITAILTLVGLADRIDAATFAAAKSAVPGDIIGINFEDTTAADAIAEICQKCLLNFYEDQGKIFLEGYKGEGPSGPVATLTEGEPAEQEKNFFLKDIKNLVLATYAWYERNNALICRAEDAQLISLIGEKPEKVSWEWGERVSSDNQAMIQMKTDWLLTRLKSARANVTLTMKHLGLARLELKDVANFQGRNYRVMEKTLTLGPDWDLSLGLERFLGE